MPTLVFDENNLRTVIDRVVSRTFQMDFNWDWPGGVAFYGVAQAYEATGNAEYLDMLKKWIDEQLENGLPKLSVNGVSIGHTLLTLYQATEEDKYIEAAVKMAEFLRNDAERFADGILQHTVNSVTHVFHEQAWVDTMMMAGLFLLRIGKLVGNDDYFEDGLRQFHGHEALLQDSITDLYYHGWDNIAKNHMSSVFWARGNGWAALTMAKALEHIEVTHPSFMIIADSLRDQLSALVRLQSETGLWHTVVTDPSSYQEVSGSAGIAAALLSRGSLYHCQIQKSIDAILEKITEDGRVLDVSAGTAVMRDVQGYKDVPYKRIQGWGQGLALVFLADLLKVNRRVFD
jgi:unsaturated rhamnogalacturonyl hydrolase